MNNKYQISKSKKPETKQEIIQHQIEELVKRRDKESNIAGHHNRVVSFYFGLILKCFY